MALAFYGERPTFTDKNGKPYVGICHHLIRDKLRTGIYRFSYFKTDGSIREAVGTLNFDLIPEEHHPKSLSAARSDSSEEYSSFHYYDLYANGWRSFRLDLFIGFVEEVD